MKRSNGKGIGKGQANWDGTGVYGYHYGLMGHGKENASYSNLGDIRLSGQVPL